uniref:RING-type domain-containing protein n=1 Tax=Bubo bubo TaxID=30461 RepID=A0A8C0EG50_BUBBB
MNRKQIEYSSLPSFEFYTEEVDDDLICHICLQPLLQPLDTLCGHTFCTACLTNFLVEKDFL